MDIAARDRCVASRVQSSIVIIDLKGEPYLFQALREKARRTALPFRWYTNVAGKATFAFNPFLQSHFPYLNSSQRTEYLLTSLGLQHGLAYGRSHFTRYNRRILQRCISALGDQIRSFADLYAYLEGDRELLLGDKFSIKRDERTAAAELLGAVECLRLIQPLNLTAETAQLDVINNQINMMDVMTEPQVLYFYLSSAEEQSGVTEVGRLAVFALLEAAIRRERESSSNQHQVYLFVDEFQQLVSENLTMMLEQARSKGISMLLSHQSISQLKTPVADIRGTVRETTRYKQYFSAVDIGQQDELLSSSGVSIRRLTTYGHQHNSEQERLETRFTRNQLIRMTDRDESSIVHVTRGEGYAQYQGFPFFVRTLFHHTPGEYGRLKQARWPRPDEYLGSFVAKHDMIDDQPTTEPAVRETTDDNRNKPHTVANEIEQSGTVFDAVLTAQQQRLQKQQSHAKRPSTAHARRSHDQLEIDYPEKENEQ